MAGLSIGKRGGGRSHRRSSRTDVRPGALRLSQCGHGRDSHNGLPETVAVAFPLALAARLNGELRVTSRRDLGLIQARTRIAIKPLPRRNWAESWKHHFKPIEIGIHLLIKPGWSRRCARPGQRVVILDPGLSFGTGHHPTTLFCLQQIASNRRAGTVQSFLDIGTGSAILAIAAAKLGYGPVLAFDYDREAVRAAQQNVKKNHAEDRVQLRRGDLKNGRFAPRRRYDLVCANLTTDLLLANAEKIRNLVNPEGRLVIAGVLDRWNFLKLQKKSYMDLA